MAVSTIRFAARPRAGVSVAGPDAASYLERMLSNSVLSLEPGGSCPALLLTAKGRVIAPLTVLRRGEDDFLLLTEPELGERVLAELVRFRLAAKAELELEPHTSFIVFGAAADGIPTRDYGEPAVEVLDSPPAGEQLAADELELLRIRAGTPRFGREIDDRVLPAEAGLDEGWIDFGKGCYPGQEPVARLRYRGHANRGLRVLALERGELPAYDTEVLYEGRPVGRVTSVARGPEGIVALAYVRAEVPLDAALTVGSAAATQLH